MKKPISRVSQYNGTYLEGFNDIEGYNGEYTITSLSVVLDYREAGVWETHLMLTSIAQ